ncbi:MAG: hypothetical protein JRJ45_13920 [Deltaproteobacteria bacterium]|nr:hypothetical protein [Deltaproteobacteria bacterium]
MKLISDTGYVVRVTGYVLRVAGFGLRVTGYELKACPQSLWRSANKEGEGAMSDSILLVGKTRI